MKTRFWCSCLLSCWLEILEQSSFRFGCGRFNLRVFAGVGRWMTVCFGRLLPVDDLVCRYDFNVIGESYRGAVAGGLFFSFFIHIITSMFYHLLSVTCCGLSLRLLNTRRYTPRIHSGRETREITGTVCSNHRPIRHQWPMLRDVFEFSSAVPILSTSMLLYWSIWEHPIEFDAIIIIIV